MDSEIIHDEFPALSGEKSNYYKHRKTALRWAQILSGKEWTDYNAHDPGVTILETLCYALTEVEYKLDFSIEDILYGFPTESKEPLKENAFYLAEDILTTAPVTEDDYRRLIIDGVAEVNNAWLIPDKDKKSVFKLLLLTKKDAPDAAVSEAAMKLLNEHRSYGIKFSAVEVTEFCYIPLNLDIYIGNQQDAEEILAKMFFNLNETILNPDPQRQPFGELFEEGMNYHDIFDGPKMNNGIIKKESLPPKISGLNSVKIKKIIAATSGIEMIDHFYLTSTFVSKGNESQYFSDLTEKEAIHIEREFVPFFSPSKKLVNNTIRVFKNREPLGEINNDLVQELLVRMALKTRRDYTLRNKDQSSTYILNAQNRNIQDYFSIKNDFPLAYGLQNKGYSIVQNVKSHNSDQLKAFLLPFEQLLANTFMRLAKFRELFSINGLNEVPLHMPLPIPNAKSDVNKNQIGYEPQLPNNHCTEAIDEEERIRLTRKRKYLTHLLARFDMHLHEDFEIDYGDDELSNLKREIQSKQLALNAIDRITANRGVFDTHRAKGLTSLENEIYLRLGIHTPPKRPLYKAISNLNYHIDKKKLKTRQEGNATDFNRAFKIKRVKKKKSKNKKVLYYVKNKNSIKDILKIGVNKSSYKLIQCPKGNGYHIMLSNGNQNQKIGTLKSRHFALEFIESLIEELNGVSQESEGFYMIDHALLGNAEDNTTFTQYRMSFIFTAWSAHFQKRSFQKKTRDLIYYLVPAHIRADCVWLDLDEMKIFEKTYAKWEQSGLEIKAEEVEEQGQKLRELLMRYAKPKEVL